LSGTGGAACCAPCFRIITLEQPLQTTCGLDVLLADELLRLAHRRVGLLTNPTGVTRDLHSNYLRLLAAGVNLVALFSPEHGFAASAAEGAHIASGREPRTGLPLYSLYGETRRLTPELLADVDILLYDLQDVGARFYTYTTTLALALEACAECGKPIMVLDRPNPVTGSRIEGPVLDPALQSFVGHGPLPLRYGMTPGELAHFYNRTLRSGADLQVIPMRGWQRGLWFDQTGLSWVPPSPNMPRASTAIAYPGMCLLEGTNLSLGRGTALPFELAGAPWLAGETLAEALNALQLEGVRFRACAFTPSANRFAGENCFGVQVYVTDREALQPVAMGLHIIRTLRALYPDQFAWQAAHFDRLIGDATVRAQLERGAAIPDITAPWAEGRQQFVEQRRPVLLYD
jgi:uncharacterized protein YbbC (DUF1343 family)